MAKGIVNINSSSSTATVHDIPVGGASGQVLSKVDATDYNVQWSDVASGGASGVISASSVVLTSDTVLSANEVGKPLFINTASDVNITLPSGQDGSIILLKNKGTGKALIKGAVSGYIEPTEGLLARYNFDSSNAFDSVGGYNGTEYNMTYVDGQIGKCAVFNGENSYIKIPRIIQDSFTIYFRFKSTQGISTTTAWYLCAGMVDAEVSGDVPDFGISLNSYGRIVGGAYQTPNFFSNNEGYNDGNWHSVCARRNCIDGTVNLTVDGVDKVSTTSTYTGSLTAPSNIVFGKILEGTNYFQGSLDTIRFYSRAITDEELATLNSENGAITENIEQSSSYALESTESVTLCWNTQLNCWNVFNKENNSILDFTDVPDTYVGQSGKILKVNSTETGLEFGTNTSDSPSTNTGNIKNYDLIIPIIGWVANTGDYSYKLDISITDVLATDVLVFSADKDCHDIVALASICPTVDSYNGGVTLYAKNVPTAEISASCTVISQGSLSSSSSTGNSYCNAIDEPPASPSTWDDEFNGSVLDSKWTRIRSSIGTVSMINNMAVFDYTPSTVDNGTALLQATPSGDFSAILSLKEFLGLGDAARCGIALATSVTDDTALYSYGLTTEADTFIKLAVQKWTNIATWSANSKIFTIGVSRNGYLKIERIGTTINYYWSLTGTVWILIFSHIPEFAIGAIGIMISSRNNRIVGICDWFRITQP